MAKKAAKRVINKKITEITLNKNANSTKFRLTKKTFLRMKVIQC